MTVAGFKRFVRQNITVQGAGTARVDVPMEVGATSESVTVTESTALLKTESGEMSHNMTTDKVDSMPVINLGFGAGVGNVRNPLQAITMVPGSSFANDNTLRVNACPPIRSPSVIEGQDATNGDTPGQPGVLSQPGRHPGSDFRSELRGRVRAGGRRLF